MSLNLETMLSQVIPYGPSTGRKTGYLETDIATPLLQINFFPDLMQVNFIPDANDVVATFVHAFPALTSEAFACGNVDIDAIRTMVVKKETLRI
jgi:hypothetical protein